AQVRREAHGILRRGHQGLRGLPAFQLPAAQGPGGGGLQAGARGERQADARPGRERLQGRRGIPRGQGVSPAAAAEEQEAVSPDGLREAWPALSAEERAEGLKLLPRDTAEDLFFSISPREQVELMRALPQAEQRSWLRGLAPDDAADVVQEAPTDVRDRLI